MLKVKKFNWGQLMIETVNWVSVGVLLMYAFFPSIEDSLEMIDIFYGLNYSVLSMSAATTLYMLTVYCRTRRVTI